MNYKQILCFVNTRRKQDEVGLDEGQLDSEQAYNLMAGIWSVLL